MPLGMRKNPRPTLKDALAFRHKGTFSCADFVSWEEREKALQDFAGEAEALLRAHLPRTRSLVLAILTCHIIVEFMLNKFIEFAAVAQTDISKERFSFAQKLSLFHMFGFAPDPTVIPSLDLLNRLRNQVAHSLDLDRKQIDVLIGINSEDPRDTDGLDDRKRIRAIKLITTFICGQIVGSLEMLNRTRLQKD
jgi:hypothetical protein